MAAAQLRKGDRLRSANGATVTADGGTTPKRQTGWMWDLTIPGNNDHDFYILATPCTTVLVHNCSGVDIYSKDLAVRYHALDADGRATQVSAFLTKDRLLEKLGADADRRIDPSGWDGHGLLYNQNRGHLLANSLGGDGGLEENLVTLIGRPTNSPGMYRDVEEPIHDAVMAGENIQYPVKAMYASGGDVAPAVLHIQAYGDQGFYMNHYIFNPEGWKMWKW